MTRHPRILPERAYALFEAKGAENAARIRRIIRLISTVCSRPKDWSGLRILDLGCGEGLFALEAACQGANVTAIDGRDERMSAGRALAEELQLENVDFIRADVRSYAFEDHGPFDVVLFLGLMYHLDAPELFHVTRRAADSTARAMILDTHFARCPDEVVQHDGAVYRGWKYREHRPEDVPEVRRARLLASLSSESSLWLTPASLFSLLLNVGFPTVLQCHVPFQPFQGEDRFTLIALKGDSPESVSFPWINRASEEEVRLRTRSRKQVQLMPPSGIAREGTITDVVVTLGNWARAHPEFVLGTRGAAIQLEAAARPADAAIWRRGDLEAYVGGLRRVPPVLAVEVAGKDDTEDELREKAAWYLDVGVEAVWLVLCEAREVVAVAPAGARRVGADGTLPEVPGLTGLKPRARELLHQLLAAAAP
jgi:SAM-dependent methyltransferase